jgi:hypothetical protein
MQASIQTFQKGLLLRELKILQPDLVIFATGWKYDPIIEEECGQMQLCRVYGMDERILSRVEFASHSFTAFRTCHPSYLQRQTLFDGVVKRLCSHGRSFR